MTSVANIFTTASVFALAPWALRLQSETILFSCLNAWGAKAKTDAVVKMLATVAILILPPWILWK